MAMEQLSDTPGAPTVPTYDALMWPTLPVPRRDFVTLHHEPLRDHRFGELFDVTQLDGDAGAEIGADGNGSALCGPRGHRELFSEDLRDKHRSAMLPTKG